MSAGFRALYRLGTAGQASSQPTLTLGLRSDSGGNALITCRSAKGHSERRLIDPVNANSRPSPASRLLDGLTAGSSLDPSLGPKIH